MSTLLSALVPQADVLSDIGQTVDAVAAGSTDFQGIAVHIGKGERQGRYYRTAAESMELLRNVRNRSVLTPLGQELARAKGPERQRLLSRAVVQNPVVREVLALLDAAGRRGIGRTEIEILIGSKTTATGTTPGRRVSTLWSWLVDAGCARERGGRLIASRIPGEALVEVSDDLGFGVAPLTEVSRKSRKGAKSPLTGDSLTYSVDAVKRERANLAHEELVDRMADNVRRLGAIPRRNVLVDLATEISSAKYLFEMKSATSTNYHGQIRRGISQLYEYAYRQRQPASTLCLVMEIKPPRRNEWLVDYVVSDRAIQMCWKSGNEFECPRACMSSLGRFM